MSDPFHLGGSGFASRKWIRIREGIKKLMGNSHRNWPKLQEYHIFLKEIIFLILSL